MEGYSKDQLLTRLKEIGIEYTRYDHPVVLTVEEQAKYIGHLKGGISKNLLLKDKKHRYYLVSALAGTNVDLKVLSQRLGVGKSGLRKAPQEALQDILQVPLGCVTPFALINDSARNVSLLLDQGFKAQECCFFHPLSNDVTISLKASDLDKFLVSIDKDPSYVDLEANVVIGKDQPPDLAAHVPSSASPENSLSEEPTTGNHVPVASNPKIINAKAAKQSTPAQRQDSQESSMNVRKLVDRLIDKISSLVLSEITSDSIKQHGEQLGVVVADNIQKKLNVDLESLIMMLKNTAYAEGYHSAESGYAHLSRFQCPPPL
ncbi:hypothetical protein IFM89_009815 [Coptis chinensis]|uniref:YbaK/aminoacyl-tRNA synthetase-associated domain-containing protein n=1 Tax=Coptis chinensis TaxID=261450 RepID=A0A835I0U1_9MAGN|nr:hypothetical protein IFM89_009815 [Coptis chinensis]